MIFTQVPQVSNKNLVKILADINIYLTYVTYKGQISSNNIDLLIGADAWANIITSDFQKIHD